MQNAIRMCDTPKVGSVIVAERLGTGPAELEAAEARELKGAPLLKGMPYE